MSASPQQIQQLQQLYVIYFNRPADMSGLAYWADLAERGVGMDVIAASFAGSSEFKALYDGKPGAELVKAAYLNLFGREAEPEGLAYWTDVIERGAISPHDAVAIIVGAAKASDFEYAANKAAAATAFTAALDTPEKAAAFESAKSHEVAASWLKGVTHAASLEAAKAAIPAVIEQNIVAMLVDGYAGRSGTLDIMVDTASRTLKIGGSATGDVGMALDAEHVATFTRGGVTASVKPDLDDIAAISLSTGQVLRTTAASLSSKSVTGAGTVVMTGLEAKPNANLAGITADKVIAVVSLGGDQVAWTGNAGKAQVLVQGTGTLTLSQAPGTGASFIVEAGAHLAALASALSGVTVSGGGEIRVSGVTAATDLSKVKVASLEAVVAQNTDLSAAANLASVTCYTIAQSVTLMLTAAQADHADLSGQGSVVVFGSDGDQAIHVSQTGTSILSGGRGGDVLELGAGKQTLKYTFGAEDSGGKSDSIAAAMDVVRNFQAGADQIQLLDAAGKALALPVALVRLPDIDGKFITTSDMLYQNAFRIDIFGRNALSAQIVNVVGGAFEGTYMNVRRPAAMFDDKERDIFIKFDALTGMGAVGQLKVSDYFMPLDDRVAPTVKITNAAYFDSSRLLILSGSDFQSMLSPGEDRTVNFKDYLDWSKLVWDIDGDGALTADVSFKPGDIESAYVDANALQVTLSPAKNTELLKTAGYASSGKADTFDVTAGFIKDRAGNAASTDGVANGSLSTFSTLRVAAGEKVAPTSISSVFNLREAAGNADGAYIDFSGVNSHRIMLDIGGSGTVTLANINNSDQLVDISVASPNFVVTSSHLSTFMTGTGNDTLTSTSTGQVRFASSGGADVMTGGTGGNTYEISSSHYEATSVADLIKGADTITNWKVAASDKLHFVWQNAGAVSHGASEAAGRASISAQGLATFNTTDSTLAQKLSAVVSAAGTDPAGTSVVFNSGTDAYLFVVGDSKAGVQAGDALIKLVGVNATGLHFESGNITGV